MKKLEVITMISQGFNSILTQLNAIVDSLGRIEKLISPEDEKPSEGKIISGIIPSVDNIRPNEKLNKTQAANILHISVRTLDRYRKLGLIPFSQVNGGKVSFRYKDIIAIRDKAKKHNPNQNYFFDLTIDPND